MDKQQIEYFRQLLESRRTELQDRLSKGRESTIPIAPDKAIGRLTWQEALQAQQVSLEIQRNLKVQLRQLEEALKRMEKGTYVICLRCEEDIARSRLEARPEAHLCIRCAEVVSGRRSDLK